MNSSLYGRVPVDTRRQRHNVTDAERFQHYQNVFRAVTEAYERTRRLSPVAAHQTDPTSHSKRLLPDSVNFVVDIQHATEKALESRLDLQDAWFKIVAGEPVEAKTTREVISRCGRLYSARKLQPWKYFVRDRYAHRRPR